MSKSPFFVKSKNLDVVSGMNKGYQEHAFLTRIGLCAYVRERVTVPVFQIIEMMGTTEDLIAYVD